MAEEFPGAGCRIDFHRGGTASDGSNRGFNRQADHRGSAVAAWIVVTALGSTLCQSSTKFLCG